MLEDTPYRYVVRQAAEEASALLPTSSNLIEQQAPDLSYKIGSHIISALDRSLEQPNHLQLYRRASCGIKAAPVKRGAKRVAVFTT